MSEKESVKSIYFLGIGGIGMSALARYFKAEGYEVAGYDRTRSTLTQALESEGIDIVYDTTEGLDTYAKNIGEKLNKDETLVVRTPAVPEDQIIYRALRDNGYDIRKRAEVLGIVTHRKKALCVAGTHGKTTTSTILAHLMHESKSGTSAFLGGISNNYGSNLLLNTESEYVVVEADEYDRSFHHLKPWMSVVTSIDPDHLDIYGTPQAYHEGFEVYAGLVETAIVLKKGCELKNARCKVYTYSANQEADFCAENIQIADGHILFDIRCPQPWGTIDNVELGVPVMVNIENSVAAAAVALMNGVTKEEVRNGLKSFSGVHRRFHIHVHTPEVTYIDDYAHHPTELEASIESVKKVFTERHLTVVFQPHLFTRTRDFADQFAEVLSKADRLILLPIYPAREKPIEGVTSEMLASKCRQLTPNCNVSVVEKNELAETLKREIEQLKKQGIRSAVMTLGAGDIDRLTKPLAEVLR